MSEIQSNTEREGSRVRPRAVESARAPGPVESPWLESPLWDGVWLLNVLWLAPLLFVAWGAGQADFVRSASLKAGTVWLWGGHILSPMIAAWRSPGLREHIRAHPRRFVYEPLGVLLVSVLLALIGLGALAGVAPDDGMGVASAYWALLIVFLLWNTWHFAAQHFGVLSIYRHKAGASGGHSRGVDRVFTTTLTCGLMPLAWYLQSERLGPLFRVLPAADPTVPWRGIVITLSGVAAALMLLREWRAQVPSLGRAGIILSVAVQPVLAAVAYPLFHFVLFSMSHWIIAIALSSRLLASYPEPGAGGIEASRGSPKRFYLACGLLLTLSLPLYVLFWSDRVVAGANHLINGIFRRSEALAEPEGLASVGLAVVVGLYFGITFVHFLYDRYLYGFRRPEVRRGVAPFLFAPLARGAAGAGQPPKA